MSCLPPNPLQNSLTSMTIANHARRKQNNLSHRDMHAPPRNTTFVCNQQRMSSPPQPPYSHTIFIIHQRAFGCFASRWVEPKHLQIFIQKQTNHSRNIKVSVALPSQAQTITKHWQACTYFARNIVPPSCYWIREQKRGKEKAWKKHWKRKQE